VVRTMSNKYYFSSDNAKYNKLILIKRRVVIEGRRGRGPENTFNGADNAS
jgi:hypothetical protein